MFTKTVCIALLAALCTSSAWAQGGTTGPLTWQLTGTAPNMTLTISGEGNMPDYNLENPVPWYEYQEIITTAIIEIGVTSIGIYAFSGCEVLTSINIPNSVTSIGDYAFALCYALTTVTLPNSVIDIGSRSFVWCIALTSITLPIGLTNIKDETFYHCISLTSINIPENVKNISKWAFLDCNSLKTVYYNAVNYNSVYSDISVFQNCGAFTTLVIGSMVKTIPSGVFTYCHSLTSVTFSTPSNLECIEPGAFSTCYEISSINIPNSVTSIGEGAFSSCIRLTSITLPNSVTSIGDAAFIYCQDLTSITIPSSVTTIGEGAFAQCIHLTQITNLNPKPIEINENVFEAVDAKICTLKVFKSAVLDYKKADVWKEFNIIGCDYLVKVSVNNDKYGYAIGYELYEANATATVAATAYEDYRFVNWTVNGVAVSKANPYSFTVTEDIELVANFEKDETGIEIFDTDVIRIHPNPARTELHIILPSQDSADYTIFNIMGQTMQQGAIPQSSTINIESLPSGLYFLQISGTTVKFVKR